MLCCLSKPSVVPSIVDPPPADVSEPDSASPAEAIAAALATENPLELVECLKSQLPQKWSSVAIAYQRESFRFQVRNVVNCLEQLLAKPVQAVEEYISTGGDGTINISWATAKADDLVVTLKTLIQKTCEATADQIAEGVELLLKILDKYNVSSSIAKDNQHEPSLFHVPSINKLLAMLCTIFFKQVVLETVDSIQKKREDVHKLLKTIRVPVHNLSMVLTPTAKCLLVYLDHSCEGERRVQFVVRRSSVFWDASSQAEALQLLDKLQELPCCKVFPLFVDETSLLAEGQGVSSLERSGSQELMVESGEGHGPRKEFFILAGSCLTDAALQLYKESQGIATPAPNPCSRSMPLFRYNRSSGTLLLNSALPYSEAAATHYCFLGWLVAQSIFNRAPLGCPISPILFRKILDPKFQPTLAIMREYDPEVAQGLQKVLEMSRNDFMAMTILEGKPSGMTQLEYVELACQDLLVNDVEWQFDAFKEGLLASLHPKALLTWDVTAEDLVHIIQGDTTNSTFDIHGAFRIVLDHELQHEYADFVKCLWRVVDGWTVAKRRAFIKFVTGTDRLPLPGTELLKIELPFVAFSSKDHVRLMQMLPQAHTCENTLELPNYYECLLQSKGFTSISDLTNEDKVALQEECCQLIHQRLDLAISMCSGYDLDEMEETAKMTQPSPDVNRLLLKSSTRRSFFVGIGKSNSTIPLLQYFQKPGSTLVITNRLGQDMTPPLSAAPSRKSIAERPSGCSLNKRKAVFTSYDEDDANALLDNLMESAAVKESKQATHMSDVPDPTKDRHVTLPGSVGQQGQRSSYDLDAHIASVMVDSSSDGVVGVVHGGARALTQCDSLFALEQSIVDGMDTD